MRRIAIALTFLLALPLVAADRIEHLAKLADLWATVKYLDPQMMTRTVDWDGALVRAIPKVREAKTDAEFAAAVGSMLAELHDPATTVTKPDTDAAAKKLVDIPLTRMDGEVLIVNLGPYAKAGGSIWSSMSAVAAEIGKAKRVVIDLRGDEGVGEVLSSIGLVGGTTPVPASFWAFHSGYQPQEGSTSGGYYSALQLVAATPLQKPPYQQTPVPLRIVFITEGKQLADAAAALWWSGAAAIVSEAPLTDDTLAGTSPVELGDGWIATLRVAQPAMRGLTADAVVPGAEAALARAMALARGDAPYSARPPMTPVTLTATRVLEAPYAEMPYPDLPYRLLSLFRLWTIIDRFYPYKHLIGDWDAVLRTMIPRFEGAKDEKEYAAAVMETVAFIEDGHSGAYGHPATWSLVGGLWLPAVQLRVVEQQYVVMQPVPDVLKRGDVVMAVDGEPLRDREQRLRKYITASMERPRTQRILNSVLRGEKDSEAVLTVRNHDGSTREVRVKRDQRFVPQPQNTEPTYRVLDGNIGYADLTRLTTPEVDAMFEALGKTKAIVFDMRGYPRGTAWSIAPRLNTNKAKYGASFRRSQLSAWSPEEGRSGFYFDQPLPPTDPKKPLYTGPTAMLIDDRAISQSEHSGLFYEAANGTTFIGSPSAGANGDVTSFPLPGGFTVAFTGHDVRHADGRQLQRVGLVPHIAVEPTIRGLRQGKDEVLERAIAWANEVTRSK